MVEVVPTVVSLPELDSTWLDPPVRPEYSCGVVGIVASSVETVFLVRYSVKRCSFRTCCKEPAAVVFHQNTANDRLLDTLFGSRVWISENYNASWLNDAWNAIEKFKILKLFLYDD